jgi:hypothetical protein
MEVGPHTRAAHHHPPTLQHQQKELMWESA